MRCARILRQLALLAGGGFLLAGTSCSSTTLFDFLNTVFLGITAAGSYAILTNI